MITPLSISEINKKAGKGQGTGSCPASSIFLKHLGSYF